MENIAATIKNVTTAKVMGIPMYGYALVILAYYAGKRYGV